MNSLQKVCTLIAFIISTTGLLGQPEYPSDVIPFFDEWRITLGNGQTENDLINYKNEDYFYTASDSTDWVVYKTPNAGGTTANSSNTRSELRHIPEWIPEQGGKLTGTLKVMQVSTSGDSRVQASYTVVIGQIHSNAGHENEPLKIFYKKFPGHTKGSVFWTYEINTEGNNDGRWDYCTAVWGDDWTVVGPDSTTDPDEPAEGIELGEEFSYEINVSDGIMTLTFESEGHPTQTFTKSLVSSDYINESDIPDQVLNIFAPIGQDGTEKPLAYAGEPQYFKQGSYNQTNGKDPEDNLVWNSGAETYNGDLATQYANGSYAEVWFKEATVVINPAISSIDEVITEEISIYPNPTDSYLQINSQDNSIITLELFNSTGQSLIYKNYSNKNEIQLDLSKIESGNYYLVIENQLEQKTTREIIKQ